MRCYCVNCELMILATTPSWEPLINGVIIGLPSRFAGLKSLPINCTELLKAGENLYFPVTEGRAQQMLLSDVHAV